MPWFRRISGVIPAVVSASLLVLVCFPAFHSAQGQQDPQEKAMSAETRWFRPRFPEYNQERLRMVRDQIAQHRPAIHSQPVLEAMRQVPRHLFVPPRLQRVAHADRPLPIGHGQTISQPYIVAFMTEALGIKPGAKILEIGTGSGYQAAVLSELTPSVFTMEIIRPLGQEAQQRLQRLGYRTVQARIGDGYFGWPEEAPFDSIIVTCAAGHIPPPLIAQLRTGGRMVIPVGSTFQVQRLMVVSKDNQGRVQTHELLPVVFVPMTGAIQRRP